MQIMALNVPIFMKMKCFLWVFSFIPLGNVDMCVIVKKKVCLFSSSTDFFFLKCMISELDFGLRYILLISFSNL